MGLRQMLTAMAVAMLVGVAACGAGENATDSNQDGADAPTGEPVDYDFTAVTVDGETFEGASIEGEPAVLWFWAPWCPTCAAQAPDVNAMADAYRDEVAIIGVGGMDDAEALPEFIERTGDRKSVV